ncbi:hypothetical protein D6850_10010 [Roseovarius spongiae]|uniref:Uncharacterized protein n=2 Tax=Roseovarius spongiae TaxID=2320272 RepID=A0A3A8AVT4_9RHOB|nr:hypothetical protein D6850_10010 [Roseovarius spongiae]
MVRALINASALGGRIMRNDTDIRYRADGSIDTGYYMQRGRRMRSEAAHRMMGRALTCDDASLPAPSRWSAVNWLLGR